MSTFVLVHGAFHGGWCWEKVVPHLVQAYNHVVALDLPQHGEDTTPIRAVTLQSYVDTVVKIIDTRKEPVILVGHSFGGMVISQAAEYRPDKIDRLVYLSALLPQNGQAALHIQSPDPAVLQYLITNTQEGWMFYKEEAIPGIFYNDCSAEDTAAAMARLKVEPLLPLTQAVTLTDANFGRVPRCYIFCKQDHALVPALQQKLVEQTPCERVFSLDTGHSPFFSQPADLAEILLSASLAEIT